jgi:hypothetical protein
LRSSARPAAESAHEQKAEIQAFILMSFTDTKWKLACCACRI